MPTTSSDTAPKKLIKTISWACVAALTLLTLPIEASAKRKEAENPHPTNATSKKKGSTKIKHQRSPSEESTAERDRRLFRECKGMPNAGACNGYTRR